MAFSGHRRLLMLYQQVSYRETWRFPSKQTRLVPPKRTPLVVVSLFGVENTAFAADRDQVQGLDLADPTQRGGDEYGPLRASCAVASAGWKRNCVGESDPTRIWVVDHHQQALAMSGFACDRAVTYSTAVQPPGSQ